MQVYTVKADKKMASTTQNEKSPLVIEEKSDEEREKHRKRRVMTAACLIVTLTAVLVVLVALIWLFVHPEAPSSPTVRVKRAAVASDAAPCSVIGTDILKKGGGAVDSAIATLLCDGVHNSQSMGIGGGSFMVIYDTPRNGTKKEFVTINARETAPKAATQNMYVEEPSKAVTGGLAVGVPGDIRGYHEAWQRFGRLPWRDLFQPTIDLCNDGYYIGPSLGDYIQGAGARKPDIRRLYTGPDGTLYKTGNLVTRRALARTLGVIADEGPDAFYTGSLAQDIVDEVRAAGGILTREDLRDYAVKVEAPLTLDLLNSGYRLHTHRPPAGGAILSFMLNVLDKFNLDANSESDADVSTDTYHKIIETFKFGYAERTRMGDEDYVDLTEVMQNLTSHAFAEHIRDSINLTRTQDIWYYKPEYSMANESGTAHISVLAPDGGAVAVTSSVNTIFGSGVVGNQTGIIYNNQMDDFSTPGLANDWGLYPSPANFIAPGKRPLSSMTPTLVADKTGNIVMIIGGAGGSLITSTTTFVMAHHLLMGKDMHSALDTPRVHHQLVPNRVSFEPELDKAVLHGLVERGHAVKESSTIAVVQGITSTCHERSAPERCVVACSDRRKPGGAPDGY